MKLTAYDIIEPLKSLIEAKELLDSILIYYDIYSGQFREVPDYECGWRGGSYPSLNDKIRNYKFREVKITEWIDSADY